MGGVSTWRADLAVDGAYGADAGSVSRGDLPQTYSSDETNLDFCASNLISRDWAVVVNVA